MSKVKNIFIGFGQKINQTYINMIRQPFEVTDEWFDEIHDKHFTPEAQAKYNDELYEELGADAILDQIKLTNSRRSHLISSIKNLRKFVSVFQKYYNTFKIRSQSENITINTNSDLYIFLEGFASSLTSLVRYLDTAEPFITSGSIEDIQQLRYFEDSTIRKDFNFRISRLKEYNYIQPIPSNVDTLKDCFDSLSAVKYYFDDIQNMILPIKDKHFLIRGDAGIGKSNLSVRLTEQLYNEGLPVIFLLAKSFSGESTDFESILLKMLDVPNGYTLIEFLEKLNSYGKKRSARVTIIVDGLNETTFKNTGFSSIWQQHLANFIHQLGIYPWIFLICTLRSSYVKRIWAKEAPASLLEIDGFDEEISKKAVDKYFNYYNIDYPDSYEDSELFLFRTPLFLSLYCQMLNPKREKSVKAKFRFDGYADVFRSYIKSLSQSIQTEMDLGYEGQVQEAIDRCSDAFLENLEAYITIRKYYESAEGREIEANFSKNNSIGFRILEEYLIYIRDSKNEFDSELIFHTYQEVGGYLLAIRLLKKHSNIKGVMESSYFKDYIIEDKDGGHQLRDDILQFLTLDSIDFMPYLEKYLDNDRVRKFALLKLQKEPKAEWNSGLRNKLVETISNNQDYSNLLNASTNFLTDQNSSLRINTFHKKLLSLNNFDFDIVWAQYVFENATKFFRDMDYFMSEINGYEALNEQIYLKLELAILLLESTIHDLRDLATKVLLEFGVKFPDRLFEKLFEYADYGKTYIYERLAVICYGICLIRQNDDTFIKEVLGPNSSRIYQLQFAAEATKPTYNYLVIDSYKHLIDLAIHKNVFALGETEMSRLKKYQFTAPESWKELSKKDIELVRDFTVDPNGMGVARIEPLRMDFVIYTISRLLNKEADESFDSKVNAVANIYKRIFDLGYQSLALEDLSNAESRFYFGHNTVNSEGKVDRLGKKYSWMAYFDFAGYLLNNGELYVWYPEEKGVEGTYRRLSDVSIEISNASSQQAENVRIYDYPMLEKRNENNGDWVNETLYHTTEDLWERTINEQEFTLINGSLEEKVPGSYNTSSYMLIDAFLVKKEDVNEQEYLITGREFEWKDDVYASDSQSNTYFGELYWADNIAEIETWSQYLPLEEMEEEEIELSYLDIAQKEEYREKNVGDIVIKATNKQIEITVEPAIIDYLWETDSSVFPTSRRNVPSHNIGRFLSLKADPGKFSFLDKNNKVATHFFDFNDGTIDQDFTYLRSDLLNKYLDEKGLVLMYQIKQHSYDKKAESAKDNNFRGMQFFFPNLKEDYD